jgi:hypothetical protein
VRGRGGPGFTRRREARPGRVRAPSGHDRSSAWLGAAATFAWSLYGLLVLVAQPGGLGADSAAAAGLAAVCGLLGGLVMGLTGAVLPTERQSARPIASSTP